MSGHAEMSEDMQVVLRLVRGHRHGFGRLVSLAHHEGIPPDRARSAVACLIDDGYARLTRGFRVTAPRSPRAGNGP